MSNLCKCDLCDTVYPQTSCNVFTIRMARPATTAEAHLYGVSSVICDAHMCRCCHAAFIKQMKKERKHE